MNDTQNNTLAACVRGCRRVSGIASLITFLCAASLLQGCQSQCCSARPVDSDEAVSIADTDRGQLAKLVGAWDFDGWWGSAQGTHNKVQGRAAATIESQYFILLDIQTTTGELAGKTSRKSGSMLLGSEPGIGLTLTAWGDASPSIRHLSGRVEQGGNTLVFRPVHEHAGQDIKVVIHFESADRWTVEMINAGTDSAVASYVFTRSAK